MMNRVYRFILFILFLAGAMNLRFIALAQENKDDEVIARAIVEYKSGQLRDPFQSYIISEKKEEQVAAQKDTGSIKPVLDLNKIEVQGIIWGGKIPQAIVNNKVLAVGDLIEGAQILSIDKGGITLNLSGEIINLPAPGQGAISKNIEQGGTI